VYLKAVSITRTRVLQLDVSAVLKLRLPGCRLVRVAMLCQGRNGWAVETGICRQKADSRLGRLASLVVPVTNLPGRLNVDGLNGGLALQTSITGHYRLAIVDRGPGTYLHVMTHRTNLSNTIIFSHRNGVL